jgi:hypothetical protein
VARLNEFDFVLSTAERAKNAVNSIAGIAIDAADAPLVEPSHEEIAYGHRHRCCPEPRFHVRLADVTIGEQRAALMFQSAAPNLVPRLQLLNPVTGTGTEIRKSEFQPWRSCVGLHLE